METYERTPELREKMRQRMIARWADPICREQWLQGFRTRKRGRKRPPRSVEHQEKLRQSALAYQADPVWRAKWLEAMRRPERLAKIAKALTGLKRTDQHREKTRQANLGKKRSPEACEAMRQARLRQTFPKRMTSIELALCSEFKKRRLAFEMHKTMFGRFQPDFVFTEARLIVQADGDYWHGPNSINLQRDNAFNALALADGWAVWRFGEKQIQMHAASIGKAVARFVRTH